MIDPERVTRRVHPTVSHTLPVSHIEHMDRRSRELGIRYRSEFIRLLIERDMTDPLSKPTKANKREAVAS